MSVSKIAARYANPLLQLALEQGKLDAVVSDVESFDRALENRDLYLLFKSPIVPPGKKLAILEQLFKGKMDETTYSFIEIIIKKGRENLLSEITDAFLNKYRAYKQITAVQLTTANKLTEAEFEKIKAKLLESDVTELTVEIERIVDPSIIGGFILNIGDRQYDASVAHQLEKLKKDFSSNDYVKAI